ncbi:hypothetical protein K3495_g12433 [Podosphaera aphanis]|nr:hypothetical protein K3495_g12433 [Podosphaera aphanis]
MRSQLIFWRFPLTDATRLNVCPFSSAGRRSFSTGLILRKLGPVPKMSGVKNPELQEILTRFRQNAVLPKHLAKNQQDLVYKKKYITMLQNENVTANISGEKFRLQHVDVIKDRPRLKLFVIDILPLMREKEDWAVLPNVLHALKNIGFKVTPPVAEKIARKAGIAGQQNVILECLRRTKDTGMSLMEPHFTQIVLYWIQYKAAELDQTAASMTKTLSFSEQILEMLENPLFTGNRFLDSNDHQRNLPETIGLVLNIAAMRATKFEGGTDKDGLVAKYATQFVTKSHATPPPSPDKAVERAQILIKLTQSVEKLKKTGNVDELAKAKKEMICEKNHLLKMTAKFVHWMMLNAQIINGLKLALSVLGPDYEHRLPLSDRLAGLEANFSQVEAVWNQVNITQGKESSNFNTYKLLQKNFVGTPEQMKN